jgi:predicted NAD/FAD-dependent oxidoreductase
VCIQGRDADGSKERWTAVTSAVFAEELLKDKPLHVDGKYNPQHTGYHNTITPRLVQALKVTLEELGARNVREPAWAASHRWGAGLVAEPLGVDALACEAARIAACGDFCLGSTFENAAASGLAAADEVKRWLNFPLAC